MCGIAGYFGNVDPRTGRPLLQRMADSLAHRGPDGEGFFTAKGVGLAHRRLAIIDLAGGAQPMAAVAKRYRIVFNGEIYNHKVLRRELEAKGYVFATRSDTEVIPALVHLHGISEALLRLRGMFAFALYDAKERSLLLARDRVGIKPLYFAEHKGRWLFGSEPKALLCDPKLPRRLDPVALLDYLTLGEALSARTAFRDISELEPGTWLLLLEHGTKTGRYWQWAPCGPEPGIRDPESGLLATRATLLDSLRHHLESDVPVAGFLSGGIDSSLLMALLKRDLDVDLATYTIGSSDPKLDESQRAARVAAHLGLRHEILPIAHESGSVELFERIVGQYDQPFADSSCIPSWLVCQAMARQGKVAISGDGGDEMFGGYTRYARVRWLSTLGRAGRLTELLRAPLGFLPPSVAHKGLKALDFAREPRAQLLTSMLALLPATRIERIASPELHARLYQEGPTALRLTRHVPEGLRDPFEQLVLAEVTTILHADYLRKIDVASGAHGLEVRPPFLDNAVLDLSSRLSSGLKLRRGTLKYLTRTLAARYLPSSIVHAKKRGFEISLERWLTPELRGHLLDLQRQPPFSEMFVSQEIDMALSVPGISRFMRDSRLFLFASLALWLQRWRPEV